MERYVRLSRADDRARCYTTWWAAFFLGYLCYVPSRPNLADHAGTDHVGNMVAAVTLSQALTFMVDAAGRGCRDYEFCGTIGAHRASPSCRSVRLTGSLRVDDPDCLGRFSSDHLHIYCLSG